MGDWFTLFQLDAGHTVLSAVLEIITAGTATATVDVGIEGGGEIIAASAADAVAGTRYMNANTVAIDIDNDTVDISGNTAILVLGKVRVTLVVLDAGDYTG